MRKVGQLVLDTPVSNVFNEVEQIAFSPAAFVPGMALSDDHWVVTGQRHLLASLCCSPGSNPALPKAQQHLLACSLASPASCLSCASHHRCAMALDADGKSLCTGITASDDKLLQSRLHAYADAQRYRIGVNYLTLPVNEPKCPFHQNANEGAMQFTDKDEEVRHLLTLHNTLCTLCSCPAMLQQLRRPVIAFTLRSAVPLPALPFPGLPPPALGACQCPARLLTPHMHRSTTGQALWRRRGRPTAQRQWPLRPAPRAGSWSRRTCPRPQPTPIMTSTRSGTGGRTRSVRTRAGQPAPSPLQA